jgi:hypothetical protein
VQPQAISFRASNLIKALSYADDLAAHYLMEKIEQGTVGHTRKSQNS